MLISIAIPFYNEEKNAEFVVEDLVSALKREKINYEIILVNNGSRDKTPQILNKLSRKYKGMKVIDVYPNQGFGWGIINGLNAASGDAVGYMCGDGQTSSRAMADVIKTFLENNLDFCQVKRTKRQDGAYRRFLSFGYKTLAHLMFRIPVSDITISPKLMKAGIYKSLGLHSKDWFMETEMLFKIGKLKLKISEIPIEFRKRRKGSSHIKFSTIFEFMKNLVTLKLKTGRFK